MAVPLVAKIAVEWANQGGDKYRSNRSGNGNGGGDGEKKKTPVIYGPTGQPLPSSGGNGGGGGDEKVGELTQLMQDHHPKQLAMFQNLVAQGKKARETGGSILGGIKDHAAQTMGVKFGMSAILKQSQVFTGYLGSVFQLMGALVDVILAPFLPIFIPAIQGIAKLIPDVAEQAGFVASWIVKGFNWVKSGFEKLPASAGAVTKKILAGLIVTLVLGKLFGFWNVLFKPLTFLGKSTNTWLKRLAIAGLRPGSIYVRDIFAGKGIRAATKLGKARGLTSARIGMRGNLLMLGMSGIMMRGFGKLGDGIKMVKNSIFGSTEKLSTLQQGAEVHGKNNLNAFQKLQKFIGDTWDNVLRTSTRWGRNTKDAIIEMKNKIGERFTNLQTKMGEFLGNVRGKITTSLDNFKSSAVTKWEEIKKGVGDKVDNMKKTVGDSLDNAKTKLDDIKKSASTTVDNLKLRVGTALDDFKKTAGGKWDDIKKGVDDAKTNASTKFNDLKTKLTTTLENVKGKVATEISEMKKGIGNTLSNVKKGLSDALGNVKQGIADKVDGMKKAASEKFDLAKTNAIEVGKGIKTKFENVKTGIVDKVGEVKKAIIEDLPGKVKGFFSNIGDKFTGMKDTVASKLKGVGDKIGDTFKAIKGSRVVAGAGKALKGVGGKALRYLGNPFLVAKDLGEVTGATKKLAPHFNKMKDAIKKNVVDPLAKHAIGKFAVKHMGKASKLGKFAVGAVRALPVLGAIGEFGYGAWKTYDDWKKYGGKAAGIRFGATVANTEGAVFDPTGITSAAASSGIHSGLDYAFEKGMFGVKEKEKAPQSFEFKINQTTNNMDSTFTQHQNLENKRSNPPVQIDLHAADEENMNW